MSEGRAIAVVGGGAAGLVAAWLLQRRHRVTLFEARERLGGHARTVRLEEPGGTVAMDTAFLIFNSHTYPLFHRLLEELGVGSAVIDAPMTFGLWDRQRGRYFTNDGLGGLFVQKRHLVDPSFLGFLWHARRFQVEAWADLCAGRVGDQTLEAYLEARGYPPSVAERFLYPMGAAVWSLPDGEVPRFPAEAFIRFFGNHAQLERACGARWQTLRGGSVTYVEAWRRQFEGRVRLSTPIQAVTREPGGCVVQTAGGDECRFDRVVLATHADRALALLARPRPAEQRLLGAWTYRSHRTVLHTDASLLPPRRRAWASWNIAGEPRGGFRITYWLNRVQSVEGSRHYFVTLGPGAVRPEDVLWETTWRHPVLDRPAVATWEALPVLNEDGHVLFCGSYFGEGFHEDAVRSAADVAERLGVAWT